jgi:hypothetical protein
MGDRKVTHRILVARPVRKRPFGRLMCRWDDNIKLDIQDVGL